MIFTLPLSVKEGTSLGYWLTPVLADALAKQHGEEGVVCYGRLGRRTPTPERERRFHETLTFLHVACNTRADEKFKLWLQKEARRLCTAGEVSIVEQESYCCPCGCLELPVAIAHFAKEKTFHRTRGEYWCRVCERKGERVRVCQKVLLVPAEESLDGIQVSPRWYEAELKEMLRQLQEQGIPLSCSRPTGLWWGETRLDVQFAWSLLPALFCQEYSQKPVRLVVTNHVLRQAAMALLVSRMAHPGLSAHLIVAPHLSYPGTAEKWEVARLRTLGFTGDLLRFMLLASLGWQAKDVQLYDAAAVEYRRFALLKQHVEAADHPEASWRNLRKENLTQGLRHVFNPGKFDYRLLKGLF